MELIFLVSIWPWGITYGDPILGMNIHLPPLFTRGFLSFDPIWSAFQLSLSWEARWLQFGGLCGSIVTSHFQFGRC